MHTGVHMPGTSFIQSKETIEQRRDFFLHTKIVKLIIIHTS